MIPVAKPDIGEEELEAVADSFESGWIGLGPKVAEFEEVFGETFGYENAVATNSCTTALDLALKAGETNGNEVLVSPITWISTTHVVEYNDFDVGWVDVRPETLNMDPDSLRSQISDDTAAIIVVHYGGQPAEMDEIVSAAREHDTLVIEDCAHAPGSTYRGEPVGSMGDIGCFSFQATKPLTTGEGGALVTDDDETVGRARRLSRLGVDKTTHERSEEEGYDWYYEVTDVGYKYFMHDISAGIGLAQLERFGQLRNRRQEIAKQYRDAFEDIEWITLLDDKEHVSTTWYNYTIRVPESQREDIIAHLDEHDVGSTVHYMPLYKHPVFPTEDVPTPKAEEVWTEILTLPMSSTMDGEDVETVISAVTSYEG